MSTPHPADWTYAGAYRITRDPKEREHLEALHDALSEAIALPDATINVLLDYNVDGYRVRASVVMLSINTLDLTGVTTEAETRAKISELGPKMRAAMLAAMREYVASSESASSQKTAAKGDPLHGALVGAGADSGEEGKR